MALKLGAKMLARGLNVPEPLVQSTGDYVLAHVVVVEHGLAKSLCPVRLARLLRAWWRNVS